MLRQGHWRAMGRMRPAFTVFWSTFLLLLLLNVGNVLLWVKTADTLRTHDDVPVDVEQVASLVGMARTALTVSPPDNIEVLLQQLAARVGIMVTPMSTHDAVEHLVPEPSTHAYAIQEALQAQLKDVCELATRINGASGLWISFSAKGVRYWMALDTRLLTTKPTELPTTWVFWLVAAALVSLLATVWLAARLNQPIQALFQSMRKLSRGEFSTSDLDEDAPTHEVRRVNQTINRMAQRIQQINQERDLMLAGISHDLRTPLARLRMETELSVHSSEAREHMNADIDQLDRTIDKFMEFARPKPPSRVHINLREVIAACVRVMSPANEFNVTVRVPAEIGVQCDPLEMIRVFENLFENARRYGKTPGTKVTDITITAAIGLREVSVVFQDKGPGVPPTMLRRLTEPFFRADGVRTAATGAGLGLAIVQRIVGRLDGQIILANANPHGLMITIRLPIKTASESEGAVQP